MKKIIIQYLYVFLLVLIMLSIFTWANSCETDKEESTEITYCKDEQVSTEETPCTEKKENINSVSEAIIKLGKSGAFPK